MIELAKWFLASIVLLALANCMLKVIGAVVYDIGRLFKTHNRPNVTRDKPIEPIFEGPYADEKARRCGNRRL